MQAYLNNEWFEVNAYEAVVHDADKSSLMIDFSFRSEAYDLCARMRLMQLRLIRPRAGNRELGCRAHERCSRMLRESEALDGVQLKCVYFVINILVFSSIDGLRNITLMWRRCAFAEEGRIQGRI